MTKIKLALVFIIYLLLVSFLSVKNYFNNISIPRNFLILGLDPRNDLLEKTQTTDTVIYAHVSDNFQSVKLFSLPRDLWFYPKSIKINQIYENSYFPDIQNSFTEVIGQRIDNTFIITTQNLKDIVNIIGGVDIYLDTELKDSQYPNQAYIDNPKSGAPMYKTIYYPAGINHLDSSNITEFVRSRKSSDLAANGGTDLGRIARQQKLFDALFAKIVTIRNPKTIFKLFQYYDSKIVTNLNLKTAFGLGVKLLPNINKLKIVKVNIPTGENPKTDIIYHPTKFINKQWVFITSTPDYQSLKNFIAKSLLY